MLNSSNISRRNVLRSVGGGLAAPAVSGLAAADSNGEFLVGVDDRGVARNVARQADHHIKTFDLGHVRQVVHGRFSEAALEALRRNRHVRYIEPNLAKYHAIAQTLPWGIDRVDADVVHDSGETGNGADIAIIDTGIDDDHEDLQGNVGAGKAYVDCSGPNCNYAWSDDNDHGTHCAGIADAVDNTTGVVGVSTAATLHAVKVLDGNGSGTLSDVASGIKYVADQGWDVGSLSLGASSGDQTLKDACQYAYDNGVLLVGAAGNDGPCSDCVGYPAAYSTVIAVSSTDSDDSLSSFSSTGPEVELAAPGGSIYSTVIGGYDTFSGTSMACPHVSGAGGQLMANGFTNTEARDRLRTTAEDIGLGDNEQGSGLLDAETAILAGFLISTTDPTNVDSSSATLNGALEDLDGASSADVYFEWRETGSSTWNTTSVQTLSATGSFSAEVTGLTTGTEYEYRAVGQASDGDTDTGATLSFTASDCVDATQWPSGTGVSGYEYITTMDLDGQVVEASSDNAYYDFTCPDVVTVKPGGSFDVAMDFEDAGYDSHYGNIYVDWDGNGDWSTATETRIMADVNDDTVTYTATVSVPSDAATGGTLARVRLSWSQFYGPSATDEYGEVEDFTIYVEDTSTEHAPVVDSLSMAEVETSDGDAEFDVDWAVSDTDGNLDSLDLALTQDSDGSTEDTATISVSGDTASGTTRLVAAGDESSGNSYTVEATVTDAGGKTDSATASASESESAPSVDSLSAAEVETSDSDAEFDVDWTVSDADSDLDSVDLTLTQDSDGSTEDTATISVSGGSASGTTRLVAAGDDGSGNAYTVTLTVTDTDGTGATGSTSITESEPNTAPTVDSLSASEVETSDSDAEFDVSWQVGDSDGNLSSVDLTLTQDSDGSTEDTATISVSGDSASGTTRLVAAGDDGSGNSYTVDLTVTDADGATASDSTSVSETEGTTGDNAPVIDAYSVTEAGSPNPHAEITADWSVSDVDGDLSTVVVTVTDSSGTEQDSSTTAVSGSSASGTDQFTIKHADGQTFDVTLTVTDANSNSSSATQSVTE